MKTLKLNVLLIIFIIFNFQLYPENATEEFFSIVRQYYDKEDYNGALNQLNYFLKKYPQSPIEINVLLKIAKTYEKLENYAKAIETYQEIAEKFPQTQHEILALLNIGYLQYATIKNYNHAFKTYLMIYDKYKQTSHGRVILEKLISLCNLLKNFNDGIKFINEIISRYPTHSSNYSIFIPLKINFNIKLNKIDDAIKKADELINFLNKNPGNIIKNISKRKEEAYLIMADIYLMKKEYEKAIKYYKDAIEISSNLINTGEYVLLLADVYIKSGNIKELTNYLENALKTYNFPQPIIKRINEVLNRINNPGQR